MCEQGKRVLRRMRTMHEKMKADMTQPSPNEDREKVNGHHCVELEEMGKQHAYQLEEIGKERTCHRVELEDIEKERARHCVELEDIKKERVHHCMELEHIEKEHLHHNVELKRQRHMFELQLRDYKQALIVSWIIFVACVVAYYFNIVHDKYD
ncbi:hypothetical protein CJ030_MR0G024290 [Morella rubra]|uniref:Uncharacterized protein n=1 Tax=Morella rubra TaxID=262757 RepID=A0A6A1UGJ6_9ROSI|nr:hypothetical protein CJ030_MR0G024290 [Morella rubra]